MRIFAIQKESVLFLAATVMALVSCYSTGKVTPTELTTTSGAEKDFTYCTIGDCSISNSKKLLNDLGVPLQVHHECVAPDHYALTFDDVPSAELPAMLAILKKEGVTATFFVIGSKVDNDEKRALIKSAFKSGHQISNHSYTHPDLTKLSRNEVRDQALKTREVILNTLGRSDRAVKGANYLRPPYGLIDAPVQQALEELGFTTLRWNADRADWSLTPKDTATVLGRVRQQLELVEAKRSTGINTSLLDLNHDYAQVTALILPQMIAMVRRAGYRFVTVQECLGSR
jgi:peptidoglycan/xylan/chitin deacetylase (PgdA/CDA1 family)